MPDKKTAPNAVILGPMEIEHSSDEFVTYSNVGSVSINLEEAILHFALGGPANPQKALGVARIYLSLPHVKRFAHSLLQAIQRYEEVMGEIPADPMASLTPEVREKLGIPSNDK